AVDVVVMAGEEVCTEVEATIADAVVGELAVPASKTTMLADAPFGTVTTQKLAPPAPLVKLLLVTSFRPLTEGPIPQGMLSQPHSIFTPHEGNVFDMAGRVEVGRIPA